MNVAATMVDAAKLVPTLLVALSAYVILDMK